MAEFRFPNRWTEVGGLLVPPSPDVRRAVALLEERDRAIEDFLTGVQMAAPSLDATKVYRATNQTIPHNAETPISFSTELFDDAGWWTSATDFVCPAAGRYLLTASAFWLSAAAVGAGDTRFLSIYQVGVGHLAIDERPPVTPTNRTANSVASVIALDVGDTLQVRVYQTSGGGSLAIQADGQTPNMAIARLS